MRAASSPETSTTRLVLRLFGLLSAVVGVACYTSAYHHGAWVYDLILVVPGFYSLLNAILITIKRPVHPGVHIFLDLVFAFVLCLFGSLGFNVSMAFGNDVYVVEDMKAATIAIMFIDGLIHITCFSLACYDMHRRRQSRSSTYSYP